MRLREAVPAAVLTGTLLAGAGCAAETNHTQPSCEGKGADPVVVSSENTSIRGVASIIHATHQQLPAFYHNDIHKGPGFYTGFKFALTGESNIDVWYHSPYKSSHDTTADENRADEIQVTQYGDLQEKDVQYHITLKKLGCNKGWLAQFISQNGAVTETTDPDYNTWLGGTPMPSPDVITNTGSTDMVIQGTALQAEEFAALHPGQASVENMSPIAK